MKSAEVFVGRDVLELLKMTKQTLATDQRICARRFANLASRGMCSQIWMPGTLVAIGWKPPRTPAGAAGFMSHVS